MDDPLHEEARQKLDQAVKRFRYHAPDTRPLANAIRQLVALHRSGTPIPPSTTEAVRVELNRLQPRLGYVTASATDDAGRTLRVGNMSPGPRGVKLPPEGEQLLARWWAIFRLIGDPLTDAAAAKLDAQAAALTSDNEPEPRADDESLDIDQCAAHANVSRRSVERAIAGGEGPLKSFKPKGSQLRRVWKRDLLAWMDRQ